MLLGERIFRFDENEMQIVEKTEESYANLEKMINFALVKSKNECQPWGWHALLTSCEGVAFALVNLKRAPLCERLTLLTSCEGFAFVTRQIEERVPAVGADTHFWLRAKELPLPWNMIFPMDKTDIVYKNN